MELFFEAVELFLFGVVGFAVFFAAFGFAEGFGVFDFFFLGLNKNNEEKIGYFVADLS